MFRKNIRKTICIIAAVACLTGLSGCALENIAASSWKSSGSSQEEHTGTRESSDNASAAEKEDTAAFSGKGSSASDKKDPAKSDLSDNAAEDASVIVYEGDDIAEPELDIQEEETGSVKWDDDALNIVFLGDSQFAFGREDGESVVDIVGKKLKADANIYNLAIGGTSASLQRYDSPDLSVWNEPNFVGMTYILSGKISSSILAGHPAVLEQIGVINPAKVDYYVIEYGANDYINGKDYYNPEDSWDVHTYAGALEVGIGELRSISPEAVIVLCGPSYCIWFNGEGTMIGDAYTVSKGIGTLKNYADTCKNVAENEDLFYIDAMYQTYFDLYLPTVDDYLSDGIHYTPKGRQIYATVIAHMLDKMNGTTKKELGYIKFSEFNFW